MNNINLDKIRFILAESGLPGSFHLHLDGTTLMVSRDWILDLDDTDTDESVAAIISRSAPYRAMGRATSPAKQIASRANGRLGGRPRKVPATAVPPAS